MPVEPITIAAQPGVTNPADRIGLALDVPLSRRPDQEWMRFFVQSLELDKLGVPRLELHDDHLRLWLTTRARLQLSAILDAIEQSLVTANERTTNVAATTETSAAAAKGRSDAARELLEGDLAAWWSKHDSAGRGTAG